ncbi:MAG: hypothetical protein RR316_03600 [Clostridia bacterium]
MTKKYKDDYKLCDVTDAKGKIRYGAEYIGKYFKIANDEKELKSIKISIGVMYIVMWCLWMFGLMQKGVFATTWYVVFPYVAGAVPMFMASDRMIDLLLRKNPLKRENKDKLSEGFATRIMLQTLFYIVSAVTFIVMLFINKAIVQDYIFIAINILLIILSIICGTIQRKLRFIEN